MRREGAMTWLIWLVLIVALLACALEPMARIWWLGRQIGQADGACHTVSRALGLLASNFNASGRPMTYSTNS